jgi:hypothetical protein
MVAAAARIGVRAYLQSASKSCCFSSAFDMVYVGETVLFITPPRLPVKKHHGGSRSLAMANRFNYGSVET